MMGLYLSVLVLSSLLTLLSEPMRFKIRNLDNQGALKIGGLIIGAKALKVLVGGVVAGGAIIGGYSILRDVETSQREPTIGNGAESGLLEIFEILPTMIIVFFVIIFLVFFMNMIRGSGD